MTIVCVDTPGSGLEHCARALRRSGFETEIAQEIPEALWRVAREDCGVVVIDLGGSRRCWEIVSAAVSKPSPSRVIALAGTPVDPALRREAYGAGVWELLEAPRDAAWRAVLLMHAVGRAMTGAAGPAVLLVDECNDIAEGIGALIADDGFRVERVSTGDEAIDRMRRGRYALILTETRRIGPDGFAVMRSAAHMQPGVPVVVLTASLSDDVFLRSVEMGASACVWKLAEPDEILRAIRAALDTRGPRERSIREDG